MDHNDRWVRFHSLPGSKQYADNDDDRAEIVRRHRALLGELHVGAAGETLVVIAEDYGPCDSSTGWARKLLPDAWPWRRHRDPDDDSAVYFWVTSGLSPARIDVLLLEVANEQADVVVSNADLDWLYHPYDGGADVIARTSEDRNRLKDDHPDWLPTT